MGSNSSREYWPVALNEKYMHDTYGKGTVSFMPLWCADMGLPEGDSFGSHGIAVLEQQLKQKREKKALKKEKSMCHRTKVSFSAWKIEVEQRDIQQTSRQLLFV